MNNYRVIEGLSIEHIDSEVRALLKEGWQPQGGICAVLDRHTDTQGWVVVTWYFFQAVTKPL